MGARNPIDKPEVMPLLLEACPSFEARWKRYISEPEYEPGLLYIDLGQFAQHLVELLGKGDTAEFQSVFQTVEDLHLSGTDFVREAATIGLLEGIQNTAGHADLPQERFLPFLLPESRKWWDKLNRFWQGDATALRYEE